MTPFVLQPFSANGGDLPGRDQARELARAELSRKAYADAQPPALLRLVRFVLEQFQQLVSSASDAVPGGAVGLVLLALLIGGLIAVIVVRLRPATSRSGSAALLFEGTALTAQQHRQRADAAAAAGDFAEAVRERLRAVVRELESRGVLDPRPGRTADEVAGEAGSVVPALAGPLRRGATVFDEVWYGGRVADAASYQGLVELDRTVRTSRLVTA